MPRVKWAEAVADKNERIDSIIASRIKAAGEAGLDVSDLVTAIAKGDIKGSRITTQEVIAAILRLKNRSLVVEE